MLAKRGRLAGPKENTVENDIKTFGGRISAFDNLPFAESVAAVGLRPEWFETERFDETRSSTVKPEHQQEAVAGFVALDDWDFLGQIILSVPTGRTCVITPLTPKAAADIIRNGEHNGVSQVRVRLCAGTTSLVVTTLPVVYDDGPGERVSGSLLTNQSGVV